MKYKILFALFSLTILVLGFGITYSLFFSESSLTSVDQNLAKFIFNATATDQLELSLVDLTPGDSEIYPFSVNNNSSGVISNVAVEYQMIIKTYHLVPLVIELYKIEGETETYMLTCDENYTRNSSNEIVCNTEIQDMGFDSEAVDDYEIRVSFPSEYNTEEYADLVDYINVEIKSWQKID